MAVTIHQNPRIQITPIYNVRAVALISLVLQVLIIVLKAQITKLLQEIRFVLKAQRTNPLQAAA